MKPWLLLLGLAVAGPALATEPPSPKLDPAADAQMRKMSSYLAGLHSFRVEANVVDEKVTTDGQKLQFLANTRLSVQRPNKLRAERLGPVTDTIIRYDGKELSVFGKRTGFYAQAPAPPTLDATIDFARARYGIDAPADDLLFSRPYDELMQDVTSMREVGIEPVDGVMCHHLAMRGSKVDWQIWIEDGAQPLPRRYVVDTKDQPSKPQYAVGLSHWEPNASLDENTFNFVPPPGSQRIKLMPQGPERAAR